MALIFTLASLTMVRRIVLNEAEQPMNIKTIQTAGEHAPASQQILSRRPKESRRDLAVHLFSADAELP